MTSHGQCPRGGACEDVTRAMSKGGGCLRMSNSGGVFQIDDVTRTMSKGGGAPGVPPIQVQTPPPPPGWLATGLMLMAANVVLHWRFMRTAQRSSPLPAKKVEKKDKKD